MGPIHQSQSPSGAFDPADEAVAFAGGDFGGAVPEGTSKEEEITGVFEMGVRELVAFEFKLAALVFFGRGKLENEGEFALVSVFAKLAAVLVPVVELAVGTVVFGKLPLGAAVLEIVAKRGLSAQEFALDATEEPEELKIGVV